MTKFLDKPNKLYFFFALIFIYILATCNKWKKSNIYLLDEAVHSQTARQRDHQADRKQTFHRTTILQARPINQEDNDCF